MERHYAMLIFLIGAGSFGFNPFFVKLSYAGGWTLSEIIDMQIIIALIVLWIVGIFAMYRHRWAVRKLTAKSVLNIMAVGGFTGLTSVLYYGAMAYLPASLAIVMLFQFVWVGMIYEWIFDRRKPSLKTILSVILTLIGVYFAAGLVSGKALDFPMIGFLLGLGAAFSYSAFIFTSGRVSVDIPATVRTPIIATGAGIVIFVIFPPIFTIKDALGSDLWLYAAALGFTALILPPFLFAISAPNLSPSLATILGAIELPVAVIVSNLGLSEHVTGWQWFGIILILFSIMVGEVNIFKKSSSQNLKRDILKNK
ncbi:multidrug transporter [Pullulanibacillus camelliae]|uniref:Multidrug transporter n=1 Tax=Pullulanibacillus camelliae TaxID=1707096 RepID=A0A8J2YEV8_9BACL|nr:DMT family transporter [Pullulanibacillus camelliae]GGE27623.1 multidrug transporter [Pullulanibacillus camelliae]